MDADEPLVLTRNLFLQILGTHRYAARASFASDLGVQLDAGSLALLSCFFEPCSPREARVRLGGTIQADDAGFAATVAELVRLGLLRGAGSPGPVPGSGYAHALTQHGMLLDRVRVDAYQAAIERLAPGRRVLEIGAGTGVLSIFAARAGAAEVVAIEESGVIELSRALARENGVADRITFVAGNSMDYRPRERAELIVHELIGHEPFAEHALRYLEDARLRLLAPGGRMLPGALEVCCRAVDRRGWLAPGRVRSEAEEFGRRHGLSLTAYLDALARTPALPAFLHEVEPAPDGARSGDGTLYTVDFTKPVAGQGLAGPVTAPLPVVRGGAVNALVMWFRARMDEEQWLTNAPGAPRTHWALAVYDLDEPRPVEAGEELVVRARLEPVGGLERTLLELAD